MRQTIDFYPFGVVVKSVCLERDLDEELWYIVCYGIGKTLELNTRRAVEIKEYKYNDTGYLFTLCNF